MSGQIFCIKAQSLQSPERERERACVCVRKRNGTGYQIGSRYGSSFFQSGRIWVFGPKPLYFLSVSIDQSNIKVRISQIFLPYFFITFFRNKNPIPFILLRWQESGPFFFSWVGSGSAQSYPYQQFRKHLREQGNLERKCIPLLATTDFFFIRKFLLFRLVVA